MAIHRFLAMVLNGKSSAIRCHITRHLRSLAYGAVRAGSADISPATYFKFECCDIIIHTAHAHAIRHTAYGRVQSEVQTAVCAELPYTTHEPEINKMDLGGATMNTKVKLVSNFVVSNESRFFDA